MGLDEPSGRTSAVPRIDSQPYGSGLDGPRQGARVPRARLAHVPRARQWAVRSQGFPPTGRAKAPEGAAAAPAWHRDPGPEWAVRMSRMPAEGVSCWPHRVSLEPRSVKCCPALSNLGWQLRTTQGAELSAGAASLMCVRRTGAKHRVRSVAQGRKGNDRPHARGGAQEHE